MQTPIDQTPIEPSPVWRFVRRNLSVLLFLLIAPLGMMVVYWYFNPAGSVSAEAFTQTVQQAAESRSAPITKPVDIRVIRQRFTQSPPPFTIAIIVGHRASDSGAVCEDGLTELAVNTTIAEKVVAQINAAGYSTMLFDEFDVRLDGYQGVALISIHADSCEYLDETFTGYKMAASAGEQSAELLNCLNQNYGRTTGLSVHENTITTHMTNYHVFRKIAADTPAVIIETGFMNLDRALLTLQSDIPAQGIANGLLCFIDTQR